MSEHSTQNPTPTVQVKEVGLPEQASAGKVLLVAGAAAGAAAGLIALLTEKEQTPPSKTESAKEYLRTALDEAQKKDFGKQTRKQRKQAEKTLKKQRAKAGKDADKLVKQGREAASESADAVRKEVSTLLDSIRSGNLELDRVVEGFAESQLMSKLKEFGDEAKGIAEQGKMRGEEATHRFQDDFLPEAKKAAKEARKAGKSKFEEAAHRIQDDVLPEAKHAAEEARKVGKKKFEDVSERARKDFIPEAQKQTSEFAEQARETAEHLSEDAEKFISEASEKAEKKRKEATKAVQKGGRETRSLLLWLSLAGILVFTVFLDEDQQKKLKEVAFEVFGEARDMYSDMKGDTSA